MITNEVRTDVYERSKGKCENKLCRCNITYQNFECHHCFWRSQYKGADRDNAWNLVALCRDCHTGSRGVHNGNTTLDRVLKEQAMERRGSEITMADRKNVHKDILAQRKMAKQKRQKAKEDYLEWKMRFSREL